MLNAVVPMMTSPIIIEPQTPVRRNRPGKVITKDQKIHIVELYKKCIEKDEKKPRKRSMTELSYVISECTGISERSILHIVSDYVRHKRISSPKRSRNRPSTIDVLEESDKIEIRQLVYCFYFRNEIPSLNNLRKSVHENENLPNMSRGTLYRVLQQLQFKYIRRNRKNLLIESSDVVCSRRNYLRRLRQYRDESRPIFFLDETCINAGVDANKINVDTTEHSIDSIVVRELLKGAKSRSKNMQRIVVLHIGNENGFVDDAAFIFKAEKAKNCPDLMTSETFEEWFQQILPSLPPQSVIVLDNAPYHSRVIDGVLSQNSKTTDIIQWLEKHDIPYDSTLVRAELLKLALINKCEKAYVVEEMAKKMNHKILRLPPFHNELNPMELIWTKIKTYISKHNTSYSSKDIHILFAEAIYRINPSVWSKCVHHVKDTIEPKMWELDDLIDEMMEPASTVKRIDEINCNSEAEIDDEW